MAKAVTLRNTSCCGVVDLYGLNRQIPKPRKTYINGRYAELPADDKTQAKFINDPEHLLRNYALEWANGYGHAAFVLLIESSGTDRADRFKKAVKAHKVGTIVEAPPATNPNSYNKLKPLLWAPDHKAMEEFVKTDKAIQAVLPNDNYYKQGADKVEATEAYHCHGGPRQHWPGNTGNHFNGLDN